MNMVFIIIVLVLLMVALLWAFIDEADPVIFVFIALVFIGGFIFTVGISGEFRKNKPSAIDVYRGKTTLRITYQDSVAIDSVVVFKNKKK